MFGENIKKDKKEDQRNNKKYKFLEFNEDMTKEFRFLKYEDSDSFIKEDNYEEKFNKYKFLVFENNINIKNINYNNIEYKNNKKKLELINIFLQIINNAITLILKLIYLAIGKI